MTGVFERIVAGIEGPRERFHALWRLLPSALASEHACFGRLPAETRLPDHTIWHHADTAAAFAAGGAGSAQGMALLSFHLGPVQSFIAAARTVRDLWSGSAILSWIVLRAMRPVLEELGPTAFVFPLLRGVPIFDRWLAAEFGLGGRLPRHAGESDRVLSLPNRFVAVVPWGSNGTAARQLANASKDAAHSAWSGLAGEVRALLEPKLSIINPDWARRWEAQIGAALSATTATLPLRGLGDDEVARLLGAGSFEEAFPGAAAVRALAHAMPQADRPGYPQAEAGRWQAQIELSARLLDASRTRPVVPITTPSGDAPGKCSQLGTWEQMGPNGLDDSREFWQRAHLSLAPGGVRLRARERLSAIALVKRFAAPALLADELGLDTSVLRFPDTATIAAADWLYANQLDIDSLRRDAGDRWSGQWLHWPRADFDPDDEAPRTVFERIQRAKRSKDGGPPPAYYAILCGDGDDLGRWLGGEKAPAVREALHPRVVEYFGGLPGSEPGLDAHRPVTPKHHAAISEALSNFAVQVVPHVVASHRGTLIYAGGDDFLALLPARRALGCARELRSAFSGDPSVSEARDVGFWRAPESGAHDLLMMGPTASLSIGVAVVHYKEDLRDALDLARRAEKQAKTSGRDALVLTVARRSGETAETLCARGGRVNEAIWSFAAEVEHWIGAFERNASAAWAYRLRSLAPRFAHLPIAAACGEIRRQIARTEKATQELLAGGPAEGDAAGQRIANAYRTYERLCGNRDGDGGGAATHFEDFVMLCQSAFFLATGQEAVGGTA